MSAASVRRLQYRPGADLSRHRPDVYAALLTYPAACVDPLGLSIEERHGNEVGAVEIRHEGDLWNSHRKH